MRPAKTTLLFITGIAFITILAISPITIQNRETILYASTTTSLYNTGLLDYLASNYRKTIGEKVDINFIAVGSGEALERAARGDVCLVFVHAPRLEAKYLANGTLTHHHIIAYNYFAIVGPTNDPAGVNQSHNTIEAFTKIVKAGNEGKAIFVSRGDRSGTNLKEKEIWDKVGYVPSPDTDKWYIVSGQGMSNTLLIAEELKAYTLTDTGTFLKLKKEGQLPHLQILYTESPDLINIYSVYLVSTCEGRQRNVSLDFIHYIVNHQNLIAAYGISEYGQPLFYPAKDSIEWLQEKWSEITAQG
ncbi:MAG: substrate-binding domain-containing protein [Desulfurococcales archaeon]|nr:substrate-binding domain-containing protein [Desulfurococcales archaeon]